MKITRKKSISKTMKIINKIKESAPKIIFKYKNLTVTLRNEKQLKRWTSLYPDGTFTINA